MAEQGSSGREKWLVAAWPGMGNVSVGAGAYLVNQLGARFVHELPGRDVFDLVHVDVRDGLARAGRLPRSVFFEWNDPNEKRDLLIFIGEAQPQTRGYAFCHAMLDYAISQGISRVFTFAAMATQLHPSNAPNVFGIATSGEAIRELQSLEVTILKEGQITGLNGVLLAAAAERGLSGTCLMGELPYFATAVPNPGASKAVLEVFATMAGFDLDLSELKKQARTVEMGLLQMLEKLQDAAQEQHEVGSEEGFSVPEIELEEPESKPPTEADEEAPETSEPDPPLNYANRQRIEKLFEAAHKNRDRAFQLKAELDRLGAFSQYEDRFLDLFKKGE